MPSPYNITNIPAPRVEFIDPRTGLMAREWYRFFFNLFNLTGAGTTDTSLADLQVGPPAINDLLGELGITYDQAQLASMMAEYEQATRSLQNQLDTAPAQPQLGTLAAVNEDNVRLIGFSTNPSPLVPIPAPTGTLYWDGGTTLGVQMTQNVIGRVNESAYYYIKASSAITKGEVVMFTGAVGSSGVPTGAPATGVTDGSYIMGIAAESIALNGFGLVQFAGTLKGIDTSAFLDGDILWYDPAVTGGLTKTKPSAPNVKVQMAAVINAGSGGSGSILIRVSAGSVLGGTDSNVQFGTLADKDLIQYDGALQYWKNVAASSISIGTATNLAGGAAGSVPYQSGTGATTFLSIGTAGQYARVNAGATAPEWASPAALTKTDDTNVTLTLGGNPTTALLNAASITVGWTGTLAATRLNANVVQAVTNDTNVTGSIATQTLTLGWTGQLSLARGGTNANLTASAGSVAYSTATALALNTAGNSGDWLKSAGTAAPTWTAPAALTKTDDTNVTLTLGGSASTALLNAASITVGWTGTLAVSRGGTGTGTAFTAGSVVFAGASGVYSQDNANLFWDDASNKLGVGTTAPFTTIESISARTTTLNSIASFNTMPLSVTDSTAYAIGVGGGINFRGRLTSSTYSTLAAIWSYRESANNSDYKGSLIFATSDNANGYPIERMRMDSSGNVVVTGLGGLGYGTGSGGAVTQATSRTTGVTLNKTNGAITLVSAAGTTTWQTFTVTNSTVAATDTIIVNQKSGTDLYQIFVTNVAAGSFKITFATTGGTTTEQPVFNFAVIKAVTA